MWRLIGLIKLIWLIKLKEGDKVKRGEGEGLKSYGAEGEGASALR